MTKIAVFADVQNIYYTTREAYGRAFDYRGVWRRIANEGEIVEACAYAIDRGDKKQRNFQDILRQIGFKMKLKPYIQRADGSAKGDWDVGITIDVMVAARSVDTVVLLSGDGDFGLLLEYIKDNYQICTQVYGVPAFTAQSLAGAADRFYPIDEGLLL